MPMTEAELSAWLADAQAKFDATRAAVPTMRCRQLHDTGDGVLVVSTVDFGHADLDAVIAGTAPALSAVLTADGQGIDLVHGWHEGPAEHDDWVQYQRWTAAEGRVSHGFIHRTSRKLLQSG